MNSKEIYENKEPKGNCFQGEILKVVASAK
jgi:hypothetical protein